MSPSLNRAARAAVTADVASLGGVAGRGDLAALRVLARHVDSQLAAGRWRQVGRAIILHNGPVTRRQRELVLLINCGPRAVLTSFTAAARWGLRGWDRPEVHVLAPAGTAHPGFADLVLHRVGDWSRVAASRPRRLHLLEPALVVAAASFRTPRPACGLLAAAVQQRRATPDGLRTALAAAPRARHRRVLALAVEDIAQGAEALSEIDLRRLCRRHGLPAPTQQAVRVEPSGRRRYLDAEWRRAGRRVIAVEVDGALHLAPRRWYADQLRQNEIVIGGTVVLRFPSVVIRDEPHVVADQLRRALAAA